MVAVNSTMLALGSVAPGFNLSEPATKKWVNFDDYKGQKGYLVMFICNHCPYVKHLHPRLEEICGAYSKKGVAVFAISSNDTNRYPEDNTIMMVKEAQSRGFSFPYLFDEDQSACRSLFFHSYLVIKYSGSFPGFHLILHPILGF